MITRVKYHRKELFFTEERRTSKKALTSKLSYFIELTDENNKTALGECSYIPGVSPEPFDSYEKKLTEVCHNFDYYRLNYRKELNDFPSIQFGIETALLHLNSNEGKLFVTPFTSGEKPIIINGLIWMGDFESMKKQAIEKLQSNFSCIKIKIGGIDFDKELELLKFIRDKNKEVILRLDANGAFTPENALTKLNQLNQYKIHSIEQPVPPKNREALKELIAKSPIPIALDEELIGIHKIAEKINLIESVSPHYLVLKPSLIGGFEKTKEWIDLANQYKIGWWVTSYLESNIGLNDIAQFVSQYNPITHQGLGTGSLFKNNAKAPIEVENELLYYRP